MNGSDASSGEMPGFPFPGRSGPEPDEPLLDMILNGQPLPADAPNGMLALADRLTSLGRPAGPGEVPGEVAAMAAFNRSVAGASVSPAGGEPAQRKPARRSPARWRAARPVRLAGGLLVVMIGLGSAAAYADVLPSPVQDFAHHVIGAPAAHHSPGRSGEHQKPAHRPGGAHPPTSAGHKAHPAKPGKARGRTANSKAKHGHRRAPAKGHRRVKRPHPAHSHPVPSHAAPVHPAPTPATLARSAAPDG
ncbi:MAG: hypothetical protein ACLQFR_03410 [Streptosporangiaceae bacterium]